MGRYVRIFLFIVIALSTMFFTTPFSTMAFTAGKPITPGIPLSPGQPIDSGKPILPGDPLQPGDPIEPGNPNTGDNQWGDGNQGINGNNKQNGAPTYGTAAPVMMPDGTIVVSNEDGTYLIYKPDKDGTYSEISPHSKDSQSIINQYTKYKNSISTQSGKNNQNYGYNPNAEDPGFYEGIKYVVNDAIGQQVKLVGEVLDSNGNYQFGKSGTWKSFLVSGYKLVGQGTGNGYVQLSGDALDGILKGTDAVQGFRTYQNTIGNLQQILSSETVIGNSSKLGNLFTATGPMTTLSKFNIATATVGIGFSAYETGANFHAWQNETNFEKKTDLAGKTFSSFGETLMGAGVISASIPTPATEVVGGVLLVTGAVLWAAGTGLQWLNKSKTGRKIIKGTVETFKKVGKKVSDLGSKIGDGLKSLFGF